MIRPVARMGDSVWLRHDKIEVNGKVTGGHDGVVDIRDLQYPIHDIDGSMSYAKMLFMCPAEGCRDFSIHPVGGGGLCREDTRRLQQIMVDRLVDLDLYDGDRAIAFISHLIEADGGAHRNELIDRPEPTPVVEPEIEAIPEEAHDLGQAIIEEITRELESSYARADDPLIGALLDHIVGLQSSHASRGNALWRIRTTLLAARAEV